jgi:hypothetical protein
MEGLKSLKSLTDVARVRGKSPESIIGRSADGRSADLRDTKSADLRDTKSADVTINADLSDMEAAQDG